MTTVTSNETKPQRIQSENLILEELQDELMIYDPQQNKAFCLNRTAAFVWKHADGKTSVKEIAKRLEQQGENPANEAMVWLALDVLGKDGLLLPSIDLPQVPAGVTRRQVLRKMGVGAMALPAVTALMVSPAKAHASIMSPGAPSPQDPPDENNPHGHGGFWAWLEDLF